jgi:hypothetical protein
MDRFFQNLNRELVRAGVWGPSAEKLKRELRDHFLTAKTALLQQGKSDEEADQLALSRIGDPVQLAEKARLELDRRDGRLTAKFFLRLVPFALVPATYAAFMFFGRIVFNSAHAARITGPPYAHLELFIDGILLSFFLVPWLVAFIWILRASHRPRHGWRYLTVLADYLALSYFCIAFFIGWSELIDSQFPPDWPRYLILISVQSLVLLAVPWRVRAYKLRESGQSSDWRWKALILAGVGGALGLFVFSHSFLIREHRERDREIVRNRIELCRMLYTHGGAARLKRYVDCINPEERASSFVEVLEPNKTPLLLSPIPPSTRHRVWTIGRARLPDGNALFVGIESGH